VQLTAIGLGFWGALGARCTGRWLQDKEPAAAPTRASPSEATTKKLRTLDTFLPKETASQSLG
jgi:hypothetical protein